MTTLPDNAHLFCPSESPSFVSTFSIESYSYEIIGGLYFGGQDMTAPYRVPISDPSGTGQTIWVTPKEYESIAETASILADKTMMDALRKSEIDIANGNTITNDVLRAKLGL